MVSLWRATATASTELKNTAGATVTPDTLTRSRAGRLDPHAHLVAHDSYGFFDGIGDLVRTGPTGTNVNYIRAILITRSGPPAE
jgi:glycerate 2-kinase